MINSIRFGGLASGLDTDSLVKQLVAAERTKVDKFTQQKILKQWQQTAYNDVNKVMANFILESRKSLGLTRTTSTGTLISGSIDSVTWLKKATSSNTAAFDVSAGANAPSGTSSIEVLKLANGANVSSQSDVTATTAAELLGAEKFADENSIVNVTINGTEIGLKAADTLTEVASKIRTATGLNANYDAGAKRFFLSTKSTGESANITFTDDVNTNALMSGMQLDTATKSVTGQSAEIKYNGGASIKYESNNISINGINLTLKAETTKVETIRTDTDVDGAYNKIKEFIDGYNKIVDTFSLKLSEKSYRDFPPLTDEQKKDMSESDVKLWEEKAKSGLLKNDPSINKMIQGMRQDLYKEVDGVGSLYELGITTGNWRDNGKLTIDEFKLKEALRDDPDKVMNTLFKTSDIPEQIIKSDDDEATRASKIALMEQRNNETGVFNRIYDNMITGIKDIVAKSGPGSEATLLRSVKANILIEYVTAGNRSAIDKDVSEIDKRISIETSRLATVEERYWRQFTAMEKAMSQMNSQSAWLSQQLGR